MFVVMKRLIPFFLLLSAAFSCGYFVVHSHSYILGFYEVCSIGAGGEYVDIGGVEYLRVNVHVKEARMVTDVFGNRPSENGSYEELCGKYGDVSYPLRTLNSDANRGDPVLSSWPNADFRDIDVICNTEWDDLHPAGSSLRDIAWLAGVSTYPYIQNAYSEFRYSPYEWSEFYRNCYGETANDWRGYPVDKPLKDISPDDLILLGFGNMLVQPGGVGYEDADLLYFPPDVQPWMDYDPGSMNFNMFALFIPVSGDGKADLSVVVTDEDSETFTASLSF